jgi:hypothetical protein
MSLHRGPSHSNQGVTATLGVQYFLADRYVCIPTPPSHEVTKQDYEDLDDTVVGSKGEGVDHRTHQPEARGSFGTPLFSACRLQPTSRSPHAGSTSSYFDASPVATPAAPVVF